LGEEDLVGARATAGERGFRKEFGKEDLVGARATAGDRGFGKNSGDEDLVGANETAGREMSKTYKLIIFSR
jgi:hypothetical protein